MITSNRFKADKARNPANAHIIPLWYVLVPLLSFLVWFKAAGKQRRGQSPITRCAIKTCPSCPKTRLTFRFQDRQHGDNREQGCGCCMSQAEARANLCITGYPVSIVLVQRQLLTKIYRSAVSTASLTATSQTHQSSEEYRRRGQSLRKPKRTIGSLVRLHHLGKPHMSVSPRRRSHTVY